MMALDMNNQRVAVYHVGDSLTYVRTFSVSVPLGSSGFAYRIFIPETGGPLVAYKSVSTSTFGDAGHTTLWQLSADQGGIADSVLATSADEVLFSTVGGRSISLMPFGGRMMLSLGPNGNVYYLWTKAPRITVQPLDGASARAIQLPREPSLQVTPTALRALLASYPDDGTARSIVNDALRSGVIPETLPAVRQMLVAVTGDVWVDTHKSTDHLVAVPFGLEYQDTGLALRLWLVIRPNGDILYASAPPNARLTGIGEEHAYGVVRDSLDAERVVRFRIVRLQSN